MSPRVPHDVRGVHLVGNNKNTQPCGHYLERNAPTGNSKSIATFRGYRSGLAATFVI